MNLGNLKEVATLGLTRGIRITSKYSPEILTVIGVVGVVTSAVVIAKQTLKLEATVDKAKERIEFVKERKEAEGDLHDEREFKKELTKAQISAMTDVGKLYLPGITLLVGSLTCLITAHGIMRKRNLAMVAAYKALEETFSEYRKKVVETVGEDKERDIRFGIDEQEVTAEDGTTKVVARIDPNRRSIYAKFFDESNPNWVRNAEYNLMFLKGVQSHMNDTLRVKRWVLLNDVYDAIGIPRTREGAIVGWVIGNEGDNFIDFDIYNFSSERARMFVNGDEYSILLDFNVNGVIIDQIP